MEELLRVVYRQRPPQGCVEKGEDGRVGSNADGEREDRDGCEAGGSAQRAQPVVNIHQHVFNGWKPPDLTGLLLDERHVPELAARAGTRLLPGHAFRNTLLDLLVKVPPNLVGKVAVEAAA